MFQSNRNHPPAARVREARAPKARAPEARAPEARAPEARAMVGVIAAGLLLGGVATVMLRTAGEWIEPDIADAEASATEAAAGAKVKATTKPAGTATASRPAAVPVGSVAARLGSPRAGSPPAASGAGRAPGKTGVATAGAVVQPPAHLDDQVAYQYNALGRRDPFQSLLNGEYVGSDGGSGAPPDVGGLKVVGIVWGDADQFALVEDARGDSHILRRGDKVMNGFVEVLKRDAMIVNLTLDGQSQSVRVPLTRKGDKTNANR